MAPNRLQPDMMDAEPQKVASGGIDINFKRIASRALRFWYLILASLLIALTAAYLTNRYSTSIYPVTASILIKESEENVGSKFLYNNELLNPYRNFYNEIYIMKSYPLLEDVVKALQFDVSFFVEGNIKTTEYYDPAQPIKFYVSGDKKPYGRSMNFHVYKDSTFSLEYLSDDDTRAGNAKEHLRFNDSIDFNGFKLYVRASGDYSNFIDKDYTVRFNNPFSIAKTYSSKLKINWAEQGASVVTLEITGAVPQKEKAFLMKFIDRYQAYDIEKKNKVAVMAMKFLDEQLLVIGDSLRLYEDQVENFKRRNVITEMGEETNRLYMKIQELDNEKFKYGLVENYYGYISKVLANEQYDAMFTPASVGISDEVVAGLVNKLIEAQTEVSVYKGVENRGAVNFERNPGYNAKLREIKQLKGDIIKTIDNARKTQVINIDFIDKQIRLTEVRLSRLPKSEREFVTIQRNYSLKENLYVYLLQKRTEAGLSKASTTSDIVLVNPPLVGGSIAPKVMVNYGMAIGAGLALPLVIFLLLEVLNNRIQSREDIQKLTNVPVIGGIGHNPGDNALIVSNKPRSAMAESFRSLRSNLNYFTGNKNKQVFLVTSSISGEGKSFTTLNLASVFAMAGKPTIIVGADLRIPKLFDDLKLSNDRGLSQYLSNMATLDEIIQKSPVDNLYLISGGPMPPNPSELLLRPAMTELIEILKQRFDYIIIDTPPITLVTDAFVLSAYSNHVLFIVRQDYTPREALVSLEEFHASGKLQHVSILFNDLRKSGLGYGYGSYGYGYGYGYEYGGYGDKKSGKKGNVGSAYYE